MANTEDAENLPIANAGEYWMYESTGGAAGLRKGLYLMWAGQVGSVRVYVWADSFESAFEEFVEYLDDEAPGMLTDVTEDDLKEAAQDKGIEWQETWPDWEDSDFVVVAEAAEVDLTSIGHTTLKHGQYIASWEWGGAEVTSEEDWDIVAERSVEESEDED